MLSCRFLCRIGCGLWIAAVALVDPVSARVTVLAGATVFGGSGAEPVPDTVVVIRDERIAAIEEAHAQGLRVAAHATQREIARRMVAAGTDILVHSVADRPIDPELLAQMRANHILYIAILGVASRYAEVLGQRIRLSPYERSLGDPAAVASLDDLAWQFPGRRRGSRLPDNRTARENLLRVHEAGITITAGSDAGNIGTLHGHALHARSSSW